MIESLVISAVVILWVGGVVWALAHNPPPMANEERKR